MSFRNQTLFRFLTSSTLKLVVIKQCQSCGISVAKVPGGLKHCIRCKCVAYCTKPCQVAHWKAGHKLVCKQMAETNDEATKQFESAHLLQREIRFGHQSRIRWLAAFRSRTLDRSMLISPHIGIILPV